MKNEFIETSRVMAFREAAGVVADTEKGQPGLMLVWGFAGRGKTECAKNYAIRNKRTVYLRAMEDWSPTGMLSKICKELNGMQPGRANLAKQVAIEELDDNMRMLLIDEADRLSTKNIEHLRDIHDETGCPIVLIGEPSIYAQIKARTRIWQRVTRAVEFGPVVTDDVLMFGVKACGLKIAPAAAHRLVEKCQGSFRLLYHLMVEMERISKANNTTDITLDIVENLPDRRPVPTPEKEIR
jgi:DNA transposition AAA+ family ATPase